MMARRSDHSREELHDLALEAAEGIAEKDGLRGLTARGVAREIGYTIGTIYNLFDDFDDLIVHLNARTLDSLYDVLAKVRMGKGSEKDLIALSKAYSRFTTQHALLWRMLFEHRLPEGRSPPDWYYERVNRLYELIEMALEPLFDAQEKKRKRHTARVLWGSLHGLLSLSGQDRIGGEKPSHLAETMITYFVRGLRVGKTI